MIFLVESFWDFTKLFVSQLQEEMMMSSSLVIDSTSKSQKFFILTTDVKHRILLEVRYSTTIASWLNLESLNLNIQCSAFFLHSITEKAEEISKYMNYVSLSPIDITYQDFCQRLPDQNFQLPHLDLFRVKKDIMSECVVKTETYCQSFKR